MKQPPHEYVAFVQWDRDHVSPPIGPFRGITAARNWARDFRRQNAEKRHPRQFDKVFFRVLWNPAHAIAGWVSTDEAERAMNS